MTIPPQTPWWDAPLPEIWDDSQASVYLGVLEHNDVEMFLTREIQTPDMECVRVEFIKSQSHPWEPGRYRVCVTLENGRRLRGVIYRYGEHYMVTTLRDEAYLR
jgi:hypothetical protein